MEKGYKNHKLISIVQEFEKLGTEYNINGIDRGKAIFFWRGKQELFEPIPRGSYRLEERLGTLYLVITNTEELAKIERIQVGYEFASVSSKYEVEFSVEINVLKDKYNQAVEDIKTLYKYIQTNMMTADALGSSIVLPQINTDEVWVKTADGWRGLNIGNLEDNIKEMLQQIQELKNNIFREMRETKDRYIAEIGGKFNSEVQSGISKINSTSESKNQALIELSAQKESSLTQLASQKDSMLVNTFNKKNSELNQNAETKKTDINREGDKKIAEIGVASQDRLDETTRIGNEAINLIDIQRDQAIKEINNTGGLKINALARLGQEKVEAITKEGDKQFNRVATKGEEEYQRIIATGIDGKVSKTDIVNDLTTGGTNKVLSAEQGKLLANKHTVGIYDNRNNNPKPIDCKHKTAELTFNNQDSPYNGDWATILTMKGWDGGYTPFQIAGFGGGYTNEYRGLFYRKGNSELTWGGWEEIFTTRNCLVQKSANGYQKLPNGLIEQWGTIYINRSGDITFPISFSNNTYVFVAVPSVTGDRGATSAREQNRGSRTENKTNVAVHSGTAPDTAYVNWRAIGY